MVLDMNEISPLEWDELTDGILDLVDDEMRAAELLLNADPPLPAPSIAHSLMAVEYMLFLASQILGAPRKAWKNVEEYLQHIGEKDPSLRRALGPMTALKKAAAAHAFDEDIRKVALAAFKAAGKAEKTLGDFLDEKFDTMYAAHEQDFPPGNETPQGPGKEYMQAQDIVDRAWGESSAKKRATLVKKALEICPQFADAHVILGNDALDSGKPEEAVVHFRRGVEYGEQEIGEKAFEEMKGHFWVAFETRPYMRARLGLGSALRGSGSVEDAAKEFSAMLDLNPNDNQGARYMLMEALLVLGRHDDAAALLKRYDEDTAFWLYPKALMSFQKHGDSKISQKARAEALGSNTHVPAYLLGKKKPPKKTPDNYGLGDQDEAVIYAAEYGEPWRLAPGALDWLAAGV